MNTNLSVTSQKEQRKLGLWSFLSTSLAALFLWGAYFNAASIVTIFFETYPGKPHPSNLNFFFFAISLAILSLVFCSIGISLGKKSGTGLGKISLAFSWLVLVLVFGVLLQVGGSLLETLMS